MLLKKPKLPNSEIKTGPYATLELLPVPVEKRTWGYFSFFSMWFNTTACVTTFMVGSSMINAGLDIATSFCILVISTLIMGVLILLNSHSGTKYGIPYSVQTRAAFGIRGSQIPCFIRAIVAAGWYGILLWIGASALDAFAFFLLPTWSILPFHMWYWFPVFLIINMIAIMHFKPEKSNKVIVLISNISAPLLLIGGIIWCMLLYQKIASFGMILNSYPSVSGSTNWALISTMLVPVAFHWSTVGLNVTDYSRFARSQKKQILGQLIGLLVGQVVYGGIGIIVSFMGLMVYNKSIWNPVEITGDLGSFFAIFMLVTIVLTTLKTTIVADISTINMTLINMCPKKINWLRATVISAVIGIALQPWVLLHNWSDYIFTWITGYGIFLGAILGILIVDYYILRKRALILRDLYRAGSNYWYQNGVNWIAIIALVSGIMFAFTSKIFPWLNYLYYYGPITALAVSSIVYLVITVFRKAVLIKK